MVNNTYIYAEDPLHVFQPYRPSPAVPEIDQLTDPLWMYPALGPRGGSRMEGGEAFFI